MLGQNPAAYGVPELNLFMESTIGALVEELSSRFRQIQLHGLLRTVAQLYGGEQTMNAVDMARRWLFRRYDWTTQAVYRELCKTVSPLRIVDKSPIYTQKRETLDRISQTFPNAFYIHLVRHPLTQGESMMKVAKGLMAILADSIDYDTDPPTVDPQIIWYQMQQNIMGFLKGIPAHRQLRLRGEEVLSDPVPYLESVCGWIGFPRDDFAVECMLHPEDSPFANVGPWGANLGNDLNFLRSARFRPGRVRLGTLEGRLPWRADGKGFDDHVVALARELGYQ